MNEGLERIQKDTTEHTLCPYQRRIADVNETLVKIANGEIMREEGNTFYQHQGRNDYYWEVRGVEYELIYYYFMSILSIIYIPSVFV